MAKWRHSTISARRRHQTELRVSTQTATHWRALAVTPKNVVIHFVSVPDSLHSTLCAASAGRAKESGYRLFLGMSKLVPVLVTISVIKVVGIHNHIFKQQQYITTRIQQTITNNNEYE